LAHLPDGGENVCAMRHRILLGSTSLKSRMVHGRSSGWPTSAANRSRTPLYVGMPIVNIIHHRCGGALCWRI